MWLANLVDGPDSSFPEQVNTEYLAEAKRIFLILESVEWKWTINQVLEQPEQLLEKILMLKALRNQVKDDLQSSSGKQAAPSKK